MELDSMQVRPSYQQLLLNGSVLFTKMIITTTDKNSWELIKDVGLTCSNCNVWCYSKTSHSEKNPNKRYYQCPNYFGKVQGCQFFYWFDELHLKPIDLKYYMENIQDQNYAMLRKIHSKLWITLFIVVVVV